MKHRARKGVTIQFPMESLMLGIETKRLVRIGTIIVTSAAIKRTLVIRIMPPRGIIMVFTRSAGKNSGREGGFGGLDATQV